METRNNESGTMPWYRLPVLWLGILIFVASMAGCVWIIVASVQYRDEAVAAPAHAILGVPAHPRPAPASS